MLDEKIVVKLAKNTLKRYEHNLEEGVLFLYNIRTGDFWMGNSSSNDFMRLIDAKKNLKEIYLILKPLFQDYEYIEIKESFDSIVSGLINKNFLEIVKQD